jgi:hypothetical protein
MSSVSVPYDVHYAARASKIREKRDNVQGVDFEMVLNVVTEVNEVILTVVVGHHSGIAVAVVALLRHIQNATGLG